VRGLRKGLTEEKRHAVADHVVAQLKKYGNLWRLSDETEKAPILHIQPPMPPK
jgi:hypothetical protein